MDLIITDLEGYVYGTGAKMSAGYNMIDELEVFVRCDLFISYCTCMSFSWGVL